MSTDEFRMIKFLKQRWFLISLVILISCGFLIGATLSKTQVDSLVGFINPRAVTAFVLFLMAFGLDSRQLRNSFRSPKPVLWASLVNYGFIPLLAWGLMSFQQSLDFQIGLMIAASAPCTMAAASVWTRKAGGNDAVSLLVTVLTNAVCFLLTPFWLNLTTTTTTDGGVTLDAGAMIVRLVVTVLLPTLLAQVVRQFSGPAAFAIRYKTPIGVIAQSCILTIVFFAACKAGTSIGGVGSSVSVSAVLLVWGTCIAVHLIAMAVGMQGARRLGFSWADRSAIAFASSQKTLPIGVLVATDPTMFGNPNLLGPGEGIPFAVFPMLMYHASQLFIDTAVADRLAASRQPEQPPR